MKELDLIKVIKEQIGDKYIGDDCAYLEDLGIVISQDSLVEDIHFKSEWCSPYQLGYKSVAVNVSDILASGAEPAYITIALSLPKDISEDFVAEFYSGAKQALCGAKIVGGDITGADKVFISVAAIGKTAGRRISSRSAAKSGYKVIVASNCLEKIGKSSKGLKELINGGRNMDLIRAHLEPELDVQLSRDISEHINDDYAMMDTSDGLADALYKIAEASKVSINSEYIDGIFGAEDYILVAAVPEKFLKQVNGYTIIGEVLEKQDYVVKIGDKKYKSYDELNLFNHFGGDDE